VADSRVDSFRINKILGFLLGTAMFLQVIHMIDSAFTVKAPTKPAEVVKQEPPAVTQSLAVLLASASADRGAQVAKQCKICHNVEEGQGSKVGPDLYDIVDRPVASVAGFSYSAALKAKRGKWTFDELNKWLANPRADVPGTNMTFAGLPSDKQRADVIVYLDSLSKNPVPLPK
jgi:cytochrome c